MSDICGFTDIQNIVESAEWLISDFILNKSKKSKFSKVRRCVYVDVSLLETINFGNVPKMEGLNQYFIVNSMKKSFFEIFDFSDFLGIKSEVVQWLVFGLSKK